MVGTNLDIFSRFEMVVDQFIIMTESREGPVYDHEVNALIAQWVDPSDDEGLLAKAVWAYLDNPENHL